MRDMTTGRRSQKYGWQSMQDRGTYKEPLYSLEEIAEKMKVTKGFLIAELGCRRRPGAPEVARTSTSGGRHLYRLSDFKKYLKPQEKPQ